MSCVKELGRSEVTARLGAAFEGFYRRKNYSMYEEIGVRAGGSLRADVLAFSMKREVVIAEVKSCWADFNSDNKWRGYLDYCNKLYFVVTTELWESHGDQIRERIKGSGAGVYAIDLEQSWKSLSANRVRILGVRVVANAKSTPIEPSNLDWLITKLAWSGGFHRVHSRSRRRKS